jgi:hypothetical protein
MSDDNTRDAAEPSLASDGSVVNGVAVRLMAWKDERGFPTPGEMMDEAAQEIERLSEKVASLTTCEAWLQKQVAERDAAIESLRLETSQTIADFRFELRRAMDERDLWTVKASQLQHLLDK